jgi:hypothetical protein
MVSRNRRLVEWSLMVLALVLLMGFFMRYVRHVQAQSEVAAVKSTLGSLRTALVLDHLTGTLSKNVASAAQPQRNPFLLLGQAPANYAGELSNQKSTAVIPGNWVFDPFCGCIGYEPLYFDSAANAHESAMIWYRVSAPPGPLLITAMQPYRWHGELVD